MDINELDAKIRAIRKPTDELRAQREEIMAEVQDRLDAVDAQLRARNAARQQEMKELFETITYEDLCDPESLMLYSEIGWDQAMGISDKDSVLHTFFEDTYVQRHSNWYGGDYGSTPVLCFSIGVPEEADPVKLARTAELLAPVLKAATQLTDAARISVMEDSLMGHVCIQWDEEEGLYELRGMGSYQHEDLLEVLKRVPTYY